MTEIRTDRTRDTVYVVGAGFSAGLGYPLTKSLLVQAWNRLPELARGQLSRIIEFHHAGFSEARTTSYPDIEQLLTEININLDLFDASRPREGNFTRMALQESRDELLFTIAEWFHELYEQAAATPWLSSFATRLHSENAAIVSFNWDLVLDEKLFEGKLEQDNYGLGAGLGTGPVLLKPHGSLNWYEQSKVAPVSSGKQLLFSAEDPAECIEAFLPARAIKSKLGRRYAPLIIPPTFLKNFNRPIFRQLWSECTRVLSTAKHLVFLGYSLPSADLHAQFIFRCGFHNQIDGRLREEGGRHEPTGPAKVTIVNPDQDAARRIEAVAGPKVACSWVPKRVEEWVNDGG